MQQLPYLSDIDYFLWIKIQKDYFFLDILVTGS